MVENMFGEFIYKRTYARWLDNESRRERWEETVSRYREYFNTRFDLPPAAEARFDHACDMIMRRDVMPSMRCMWTAGKALDVENMCAYNCTFLLIDSVKAWADMLYLLMNGCGVGYSVERQVIVKLPEVPSVLTESPRTVVFEDSKLGWAEGLMAYLACIYNGEIPKYDLSMIRPKGTRLKTFGGRAGGSDDLRQLLDYLRLTFVKAKGRQLTSIECHDICCWIANVVVSAGIRRSACISLSNLSDQRMRNCKTGEFWLNNPQRQMANNSVAYTEKPDMHIFMQEWMSLMESGSGERGIFNRKSSLKQFEALGRRTKDDNDNTYHIGTNPCGEIVLRPKQACNLSEVVVRPGDTLNTLLDKVEAATILGCMQACLTDIQFLDSNWKKNMEDERLLGVSLTGTRDHSILGKATQLSSVWLNIMRDRAHSVAADYSKVLGINKPVAITCNKPSGTVSALLDTASGLHTRFSEYYIRRVRVASTDVMCKFLMGEGVPHHPDVGQDPATANTWVFEFPIKAPDGAVFDTPALEQLEYWRMYKTCWTDHNPSITIMVKDDEWMEVGAWVYRNWDIVGGLSFLPKSDNVYQLAPFEEITKQAYEQRLTDMPDIDFAELDVLEHTDETTGAQTIACVGGSCEVI